jgi:hypothetical protein
MAAMDKVHRGSTFCHAEVAESSQRLKEQKEFALFLASVLLWASGRRRRRTACLDDPLNPVCVKARYGVQVKNLFYPPHKLGFPGRNALFLFGVKLTSLFFTFCHTISYEMFSTIFNCYGQRFRSFVALLWAGVSRIVFLFSSGFLLRLCRGYSLRAACGVPFTNRWWGRCTVDAPAGRLAISRSFELD